MKLFDYRYDPYWRDKDRFDILAVQGQQTDTGREPDHEHVTILRRHFAPVCRARRDHHSTAILKAKDGQPLYRVGTEFMPRSEMIAMAERYRGLKPKFF